MKRLGFGFARSAAVSLLAGALLSAACARASGCAALPPNGLTQRPAAWLGACGAGKAEGLGVMRAGPVEPHEFFLGSMRRGLPTRGIILTENGLTLAVRLDASGRNLTPPSIEGTETHAMFQLAERAAETTARRFDAAGARASANYYRRLAKKIAAGEPE